MKQTFFWTTLFVLSNLSTSGLAQSQKPTPVDANSFTPVWENIFSGIDQTVLVFRQPRLMRGVAVRIDTKADGMEFVLTPDNGAREGETDGLRTSTFLKKHQCQIAVNAAPFSPIHLSEGQPQEIVGWQISKGKQVSGEQRHSIVFDKHNRGEIVKNPKKTKSAWNAVSGFGILLRNGKNLGSKAPLHPRTAIGLSKNKRYVYLLVIDGRQKGYSLGASTSDLALILTRLGAHDGLNLDGGGTSTMVRSGDTKNTAIILNRPVHGGIPGFERVSASHFGVRAKAREK